MFGGDKMSDTQIASLIMIGVVIMSMVITWWYLKYHVDQNHVKKG